MRVSHRLQILAKENIMFLLLLYLCILLLLLRTPLRQPETALEQWLRLEGLELEGLKGLEGPKVISHVNCQEAIRNASKAAGRESLSLPSCEALEVDNCEQNYRR